MTPPPSPRGHVAIYVWRRAGLLHCGVRLVPVGIQWMEARGSVKHPRVRKTMENHPVLKSGVEKASFLLASCPSFSSNFGRLGSSVAMVVGQGELSTYEVLWPRNTQATCKSRQVGRSQQKWELWQYIVDPWLFYLIAVSKKFSKHGCHTDLWFAQTFSPVHLTLGPLVKCYLQLKVKAELDRATTLHLH